MLKTSINIFIGMCALFANNGVVFAAHHIDTICGTEEHCQDLRREFESQIQKIDKRLAELNIPAFSTSAGVTLTRSTKYPVLGEAFRDPSGLIWSDALRKLSGYSTLSISNYSNTNYGVSDFIPYDYAFDYCKKIGARLPTDDEVMRLFKYMGADSPAGYKAQILPNFRHDFWVGSGKVADTYSGKIYPYDEAGKPYGSGARCVRNDD